MHTNDIKVWDIVVRLFHWSLVVTFLICIITEDSSTVHIYSGYFIILLITVRFIWGFIGTEYARFKSFIVAPGVVFQYLKDMLKNNNQRYLGHNPAGSAMILTLITSITITCVTGLVLYAVDDHSGPLALLIGNGYGHYEDILEEAHEFFSNFSLFLIVFHVSGVIIAGKQHNENLVKSMINGYKQRSINPDQNI